METEEEYMKIVKIFYDDSNNIHIESSNLNMMELMGMADLLHAQSLAKQLALLKEIKTTKKPKKVG